MNLKNSVNYLKSINSVNENIFLFVFMQIIVSLLFQSKAVCGGIRYPILVRGDEADIFPNVF